MLSVHSASSADINGKFEKKTKDRIWPLCSNEICCLAYLSRIFFTFGRLMEISEYGLNFLKGEQFRRGPDHHSSMPALVLHF